MKSLPLLTCVALLGAVAQADQSSGSAVHDVWRDPSSGIDVAVHPCAADPALLCGDIVRLPSRGPTTDVHNPDPALRTRPLLGLEILSGFVPVAANRWQGGGKHGRLPGRIYLPVNGDTLGDHRNRYEIRLDGDRLEIGIANCKLLGCLSKHAWQRASTP